MHMLRTFELSGRRRQYARPGPVKMYRVPPARAWWPAVGAPLERGVRHQCAEAANWKLLPARPRQRRVLNVLVIDFVVFNIFIGIKAAVFHEGPSVDPIEGVVDLEH